MTGGRYFGFVNAEWFLQQLAANWLAVAWTKMRRCA